MEKDKNNLEKKEDTKDNSEEDKSNSSKSVKNRKIQSKKHYSDNTDEREIKKAKEAKFFQKSESIENDNSSEDYKKESSDVDEEPGLTEEEIHEATLVIVDSLTQEVAEELVGIEPDSAEEFEALADAVFLEELIEIAEGDGDFTEESIDHAFNETLSDLNIEVGGDEILPEEESANELETITDNYLSDSNMNEGEYIDSGATQNINLPRVNGSIPPIRPPSPTTGIGPQFSSLPSTSNYGYDQFNTQPVPREVTRNVEVIHGRRSDMLVGAVIGYIVGRRGGRKRTEKKLQPKINKLEEQVTELQYKIVNKEAQIRNIARQKAESYEKMNLSENKNKSLTEKLVEQRQIKKKVKENLKRREELTKDPGVEKIGKFSLPALKVFHERRLPDGSENSSKRKQVEVMTENELLEKIEGLQIEGYSIREVYKNGRLDIESLRQITKEYLRGGPYKQTFIRELLRDNQEIEKSREVINNMQDSKNDILENNNKVNEKTNTTLSKEQALKKAEALLMTQTMTSAKPKSSRLVSATITALVVVVCVFIILLLS